MKGIFLLINNLSLGKKILYFDATLEWADQSTILKSFQNKVTLLNGTGSINEGGNNGVDEGVRYGLTKSFFREQFLPAASTFQNDIFEVTIEQNRFICYPYYFPDDSETDHPRKGPNKQNKQGKMLQEKKQLIEQLV